MTHFKSINRIFNFLGLPEGLQKRSAALVHHRNRRTIFICAVIVLMSAASSIGLFVCQMTTTAVNTVNSTDIRDNFRNNFNYEIDPIGAGDSNIKECIYPEYMVFTWVLCLIALATGLKLYYLIKTFMAFIMVLCYAVLILAAFPNVFNSTNNEHLFEIQMPLQAQMIILLVIFLTMVTYHARLVEVTSRLDFIWKEQAEKELANMKSNRFINDVLIKVIIIFTNYKKMC